MPVSENSTGRERSGTCEQCGGKHHTLNMDDNSRGSSLTATNNSTAQASGSCGKTMTTQTNAGSSNRTKASFMIILVVLERNGRTVQANALMDSV